LIRRINQKENKYLRHRIEDLPNNEEPTMTNTTIATLSAPPLQLPPPLQPQRTLQKNHEIETNFRDKK